MKKLTIAIIGIVLIIVLALLSTIVCPVLVIAEDTTEGDPGIDMAATLGLGGYTWIYPGSSFNEQGQTLHNVHLDNPQDPYGAARDIMTYTYHYTPHVIISVNDAAAQSIFGESIIDDIRVNDAYNGYAGSENVQGTMDRGDAVDTAMSNNGMNIFEIPVQFLMGNINVHFV